jgi:hypothetical protein
MEQQKMRSAGYSRCCFLIAICWLAPASVALRADEATRPNPTSDATAEQLDQKKREYLKSISEAAQKLDHSLSEQIDEATQDKRARDVERALRVEQLQKAQALFHASGLVPAIESLPKRDQAPYRKAVRAYSDSWKKARKVCEAAYKEAIRQYDKADSLDKLLALHREMPVFLAPPGGLDFSESPWISLFNGKDKSGWFQFPNDKSQWQILPVEDSPVLEGSGPGGFLHLDLPQFQQLPNQLQDVHLRAEVCINDGGNSGLFLRTQNRDIAHSYEAQINATAKQDPHRTGSLILMNRRDTKIVAPLSESPHRPEEWVTLDFVAFGNRMVVAVQGQITADWIDQDKHYSQGGIAIQQHHPGSKVQFKRIELRNLQKK